MKIAIIGTRGIPNRYGGFEQFASYLAPGLIRRGHHVSVYNSSTNGYKGKLWNDVEIITKNDPEKIMGTASQFVYDLLCITDARKRKFDLILQLGYTSSSVWNFLFPRDTIVATSMDGLEWKRKKYNRMVQKFLQYAEKQVVKQSDVLIADATAMRKYLYKKYNKHNKYDKNIIYIPYGAIPFCTPDPAVLANFHLKPFSYDLVIARLEPENNHEMIIKGYLAADTGRRLVIIGNTDNTYGKYLRKKYTCSSIIFKDSLYDMEMLNNLRYYSNIYFHGHSAGGTNPSLLEAMAAHCLIAAHNNIFNHEVLGKEAYYFKRDTDITDLLNKKLSKSDHVVFLKNNIEKIRSWYNWENVLDLIELNIIDRYGDRI